MRPGLKPLFYLGPCVTVIEELVDPYGQVCTKMIAQQNFPKATFFLMFHFQTVGATGAIKICE